MPRNLFRFHRGALKDSLSTVKEFEAPVLVELAIHILDKEHDWLPEGQTIQNLKCETYCKDTRPNMTEWARTWVVTCDPFSGLSDRPFVIGFANCKFE